MNRALLLSMAIALALAGCLDDEDNGDVADTLVDSAADSQAVDTQTVDTQAVDTWTPDTQAPDSLAADTVTDTQIGDTTGQGCAGNAPFCAPGCGGDVILGPAICVGGDWVCEQGVVMSDCPPGTCWGLPFPGEVCDDGWKCRPEDQVYDQCPDTACITCEGFDAPVTKAGCTCACVDGAVICGRKACESTLSSNLSGVEIGILGDCAVTQAEAAAGVTFTFDVNITSPVLGVVPKPQDAGRCGRPGPSGLTTFTEIRALSANGPRYCICDTGLCMEPSDQPVDLAASSSSGSFEWDGRAWMGPSDTGNPKGDPFPPGRYDVIVSAIGTQQTSVGTVNNFTVKATAPLWIWP